MDIKLICPHCGKPVEDMIQQTDGYYCMYCTNTVQLADMREKQVKDRFPDQKPSPKVHNGLDDIFTMIKRDYDNCVKHGQKYGRVPVTFRTNGRVQQLSHDKNHWDLHHKTHRFMKNVIMGVDPLFKPEKYLTETLVNRNNHYYARRLYNYGR